MSLRDRGDNGFYPVADYLSQADLKALGIVSSFSYGKYNVKAVPTGEFRPPKAGEWYLSGAIVQAWRASNDLELPFHLCRLVKTKTITTIVEDDG